jgi:hypothetical protein
MNTPSGPSIGRALPAEEAKEFCRAMQRHFRVPGGGYPTWRSLKDARPVTAGILGCDVVRDSPSLVFVNEGRPPRARELSPRELGALFRRRGPWDGHGYATTRDLRWCIAFSGEESWNREMLLFSGPPTAADCLQPPPSIDSLLELQDGHNDRIVELVLRRQDASGKWWGELRGSPQDHPVWPLMEQSSPDFSMILQYGLRLVVPSDESVPPWYPVDSQVVDGRELTFSLDLHVFRR